MNNTGGYRNDRQDRADNRAQNTAPRGNYSHRNGQAADQQRPAQGQQRPVQGQRPANRPPQPQQQRPSRPQQSGAPVQPRQPSEVRRNTASTSVAPAKRPGKVSKPKKPDSRAVAWVKHIFRLKDDEVVRVRYTEDSGYDYVFLVIVLVLLAFGTIMVYSASYAYSKWKYDDSYYIISRQFMFMAVGLVGMMFTMRLKPDTYRAGAVPLFLVCFFLLCIVPIPGIGRVHGGARRWLSIGFTEIQPSEFMKTGLVFMLAWYIDRYHKRITDLTYRGRASFFGVYVPLAITAVVCLLMVLEKHLSGTIIMFAIGIVLIFVGGANTRPLYVMGAFGVSALAVLAFALPHARQRIEYWLHPELDPQGKGYQTLQGLYAIGSGGFFGVGLGESRQKHLYVSQPQNDFIFTIVCEELGFVGAATVILLFLLFLWRGISIAMKAPDVFSQLVVAGIVSKVVIQAVLNIAVVTKSIPNTGISLPFFSYGGSSLCVLIAEMGIVLSISRYTKQKK